MKKVICLLMIICMSFSLFACKEVGLAYKPLDATAMTVEIVPGSTAVTISQQLQDEGIIESADTFRKWLKKNGYDSRLQAGRYTLSPSMNYESLAEIIVGGKINTITFTIPEGLTYWETAKVLAEQGIGDYDKLIDVMENGDFSSYEFIDPSLGKKQLEGYLLPDTYVVDEGYSENMVVVFLLSQFKNRALAAYQNGSPKVIENYSLADIIKVASLIEKEVGRDDERQLVSSVIYNRLRDNDALQFCSSVQYVLLETTGKVHDPLLYEDMEIDSPYNLYRHKGLTPTPICNPSLASIEAATRPLETPYKFFVLSYKLDGSSEFSATYEEHLKLSEKYYKAAGLK